MSEAVVKCKVANKEEALVLLEMCNHLPNANLLFNELQAIGKEKGWTVKQQWVVMKKMAAEQHP